MKRYSRLAMVLAVAGCLAQAGQALAGSQTFPDTTLVFPNYTGTDTRDTIITPQINSMTVNWNDDGFLTSIVINSSSAYVQWDSLFINSTGGQSWDAWDYLVHSGTGNYGTQEGASSVPGPGLYAVSDNYDYTHASEYRVDHVNGIDAADLTMLEDGFQGSVSNPYPGIYALVYDFTSLDTKIQLGDNFVIGYSPFCANDVILAYGDGLSSGVPGGPGGKGPGAVPEPATMILFGAGLAGLAGWQSRRWKK